MNKILLFSIVLIMTGHQVAIADDSQRLKQMEGEMETLKSASVAQDERIRSLENRVTARGAAFSRTKASPANAAGMTPDENGDRKTERAGDGEDRKYIE